MKKRVVEEGGWVSREDTLKGSRFHDCLLTPSQHP